MPMEAEALPPLLEVWLVTAPGYDLRLDMGKVVEVHGHPYGGSRAVLRENKELARVLEQFGGFSLDPAVPPASLQPIEQAALVPPQILPKTIQMQVRAALYDALLARDGVPKGGREAYTEEVLRLEAMLRRDRATALSVVDSFRDHIVTLYPYFRVRLLRSAAAGRDALRLLREVPGIRSAEAAPLLARDAAFSPTDPLYNAAAGGPRWDRGPREIFPETWRPRLREQWNLAAIEVEAAWASDTRGQGVTVAVVDTGIDARHPDLAGRLHPLGDTGLTTQPRREGGEDPHGTLVAGIIAAESNAEGITGIAPAATLLSCTHGEDRIRTPRDPMVPSALGWVAAIVRAVGAGAKVINCSWHVETPCCEGERPFAQESLLKEAVLLATRAGAVVVTSMGNSSHYGMPRPYPSWPASLDRQTYKKTELVVVSVGGVDVEGVRFPSSNYGPAMTLVAPGYEVPTTDLTDTRGVHVRRNRLVPWLNSYAPFGGTSAAAAHASGVLALMLAAAPKTTPAEARDHLIATAQKIGPLSATNPRDDEYGHGLLRARAVARAAGTSALNTLISAFAEFNSRDAEIFRQVRDDLMVRTRQGQVFAVRLAAVAEELHTLLVAHPEAAAATLDDLRATYAAIEVATGRCMDSDPVPLPLEVVLDSQTLRRVWGLLRRLQGLGPSPALKQAMEDLRVVLRSLLNEKRIVALRLLGADPDLLRQQWSPLLEV